MAKPGKFQILVLGAAKFNIVFADAAVINIQPFTEVEITPHVNVIKPDILYQITDEITDPV